MTFPKLVIEGKRYRLIRVSKCLMSLEKRVAGDIPWEYITILVEGDDVLDALIELIEEASR